MANQRTHTQTRQGPQERVVDQAQRQPAPQAGNGHGAKETQIEKEIVFVPFGEEVEVKLTVNMVRTLLCQPTKQGHWPSDAEVGRYIMVCKHRRLNPWVGDCWLLGYDSEKGPKFSIVVAVQALLKRAELNPTYEGIESGIVVERDGQIVERPGDLIVPGEKLLGGWATVYRQGKKPFYQRLSLASYNKNTPQWRSDPCGMISKCCEAASLRQAFPNDTGGLYTEHELRDDGELPAVTEAAAKAASARSELADRLSRPAQATQERVVGKSPTQQSPPEQTQARQEAQGEHDQTAESDAEEIADEAQEPTPEGQEATQEAAGAVREEVKFGE